MSALPPPPLDEEKTRIASIEQSIERLQLIYSANAQWTSTEQVDKPLRRTEVDRLLIALAANHRQPSQYASSCYLLLPQIERSLRDMVGVVADIKLPKDAKVETILAAAILQSTLGALILQFPTTAGSPLLPPILAALLPLRNATLHGLRSIIGSHVCHQLSSALYLLLLILECAQWQREVVVSIVASQSDSIVRCLRESHQQLQKTPRPPNIPTNPPVSSTRRQQPVRVSPNQLFTVEREKQLRQAMDRLVADPTQPTDVVELCHQTVLTFNPQCPAESNRPRETVLGFVQQAAAVATRLLRDTSRTTEFVNSITAPSVNLITVSLKLALHPHIRPPIDSTSPVRDVLRTEFTALILPCEWSLLTHVPRDATRLRLLSSLAQHIMDVEVRDTGDDDRKQVLLAILVGVVVSCIADHMAITLAWYGVTDNMAARSLVQWVDECGVSSVYLLACQLITATATAHPDASTKAKAAFRSIIEQTLHATSRFMQNGQASPHTEEVSQLVRHCYGLTALQFAQDKTLCDLAMRCLHSIAGEVNSVEFLQRRNFVRTTGRAAAADFPGITRVDQLARTLILIIPPRQHFEAVSTRVPRLRHMPLRNINPFYPIASVACEVLSVAIG